MLSNVINGKIAVIWYSFRKLIWFIKSPRYTEGDFMFLYRFVRRRRLRWNSCISEWEGRLTLHKGGGSRSFMTMTIWWPRSGVWIYQIVTGVTSVVGVASTHLVYLYFWVLSLVWFGKFQCSNRAGCGQNWAVSPYKYTHKYWFLTLSDKLAKEGMVLANWVIKRH